MRLLSVNISVLGLLIFAADLPSAVSKHALRGAGAGDNAAATEATGNDRRRLSGSSTQLSTRIIDYPKEGVELGQGWDSIRANKKNTVGIIFEPGETPPGQERSLKIVETTDKASLMKAMDISADMQYKSVFGTKVSAKFSFASDITVNSMSQTFLARATVENPREYVAPVAISRSGSDGESVLLTPRALELASTDIDEFHRIYGDSYVASIHSGAEMVASMTFDVQEKSERADIGGKIAGSGWGFSAKGSFRSTMDTYSQESKLEIYYYQAGGSGDATPTDTDGFRDKIAELPELALDSPYPYAVTLQRYDSLPNWPRVPALPKQPSDYDQMIRRFFEYKTLYDEIETIEENPEEYVLGRGIDFEGLEETKSTIIHKLRQMKNAFDDFDRELIHTLPLDSFPPDYEYRTKLPLPSSYVDSVDFTLIDGDDLSELIAEFWIEKTSDNRCDLLGVFDLGCLDPAQEDHYASLIPKNYPVVVGSTTHASTDNSKSPWRDQTKWGKQTGVKARVATMRAWSKYYGEGQQTMDFYIDYADQPGIIRGVRQLASSANSKKPFIETMKWGYFGGFEQVKVADYQCWSKSYGWGFCHLYFALDLTATQDGIKGFEMDVAWLNGSGPKPNKFKWGAKADSPGHKKELVAHFRSWDKRRNGSCQGYLNFITETIN